MANEAVEIVVDKTLWPETSEQRAAQAKIGEADIAECRLRMANLSTPGRLYHPETGEEIVVPAKVTRAMFEAEKSN